MNSAILSLYSLNIGSPSEARAEKLSHWLDELNDDLIVLTETGVGKGTRQFLNKFLDAGFSVECLLPEGRSRGVLIASRLPSGSKTSELVDYLPERFSSLTFKVGESEVELAGIYVPSRDSSPEKVERKKTFLQKASNALTSKFENEFILLGDLNVLERDHTPKYKNFLEWEYQFYEFLASRGVDAFRAANQSQVEHSWVGRTGDGYRYDHAFVSSSLKHRIVECCYDHEPRKTNLTDHSGIRLQLKFNSPIERIPTSKLNVSQPTLF